MFPNAGILKDGENDSIVVLNVEGSWNENGIKVSICSESDVIRKSELVLRGGKIVQADTGLGVQLKKKSSGTYFVDPANVWGLPNIYPGQFFPSPEEKKAGEEVLMFGGFDSLLASPDHVDVVKYEFYVQEEASVPTGAKKGRVHKKKECANGEVKPLELSEMRRISKPVASVRTVFKNGEIVLVTHESWVGSFLGFVQSTIQDPFYAEGEGFLLLVQVPYEAPNEKGVMIFTASTFLISLEVAESCLLKVPLHDN